MRSALAIEIESCNAATATLTLAAPSASASILASYLCLAGEEGGGREFII